MADGGREVAAPGGRTLRERFADLAARVVSAVILVLVVVILLWWGEIPFTAGMTLIVAGGLWELHSTFRRHGYRPAGWLSLAAGCSFPVMAYFLQRGESADLTPMVAALALCVPVLLAWCLFGPHSGSPTTDVAVSLLGVVLVGFCLSHFVLMLRFDTVSWTAPFAVIVMVWIYDAVAYFAGSAFGKHKLAPRISPGKSWEGTLAGSAGAFIAAYILYLTLNRAWLTLGVSMELAAVVCVFGPLGDLSESMVKRELGIKDMSSLIPGHGGIMDRFDSMFLTAAVSYYFLRFLVFKA
ncbi:phosphatidate cytidylyltransferase [Candidatus Solincola tengchongensis]|uniref:phosphatidate cytidylyltransferase n=1 Tax=Candidatus Solincola tengchongensis TaxID=2900693 RepID=UPI00257B245D|nr:phosphatidate cytidylyltransferase [Candidatus Solincola tengchongensis]